MGLNREHVIWQSENRLWNIGFYAHEVIGPDYEWDVRYDYEEFDWVSTGHSTMAHAEKSWNGANPGCDVERVPYTTSAHDLCKKLDTMARWLDYPEERLAYYLSIPL